MSAKKIKVKDDTKLSSFFGEVAGIVFCVCAIAKMIGFTIWLFRLWGIA